MAKDDWDLTPISGNVFIEDEEIGEVVETVGIKDKIYPKNKVYSKNQN